jgi:hypothetical protein
MKVVGVHHSDHIIDKPDLIALWPGNLCNPTIGIGITTGEHFLEVVWGVLTRSLPNLRRAIDVLLPGDET